MARADKRKEAERAAKRKGDAPSREDVSDTQSGAKEPAAAEQGAALFAPVAPAWYAGLMLQGWVSLAVWMGVGLLLEGLLGYKIPSYLADPQRREMFRLAHTHGTFLGLVLIAAALWGERRLLPPPRVARFALRLGSVLMPLGFLLGGVWHTESDPGFAIWLVPPAALLVIFGAISIAVAGKSSSAREG
jgi:hypothetical protein